MEELKAEVGILWKETEILRGLGEKEKRKSQCQCPRRSPREGKEEGRKAAVRLWSGIVFVKGLYSKGTWWTYGFEWDKGPEKLSCWKMG